MPTPPKRRLATIAAIGLIAAAATACRPELIVGVETRIYPDGSLDRRVELRGLTDKGEVPDDPDWLAEKIGLEPADPAAWGRVEEAPGHRVVEGFFLSAQALPPLFVHATEQGVRADRGRTVLEIDERAVLKRWVYRQHQGDVYGPEDHARAVDGLIELAAEALRSEVADHLGSSVDPGPAVEWLRNDVRSLVSGLMTSDRRAPGWARTGERNALWSAVLAQHGVPPAAVAEPETFWDVQLPVLLEWSRAEVARVLSTEQRELAPHDLGFWPVGEDAEERVSDIVERVWGAQEDLEQRIEPHLATLSGFYGGDDAPRTRFEVRATLPGMLLATNGTPDAESVVWLLREDDLSFGERVLRAESVELQDEALRRLGARRSFTTREIVRLADLLWTRDPEGHLAAALERGIERGDLELLSDPDELPAELHPEARELHLLLRGQI